MSAGGAEAVAPAVANWLYGSNPDVKKDAKDNVIAGELTAEQKNTISNIIGLGTAGATGLAGGSVTDVVSSTGLAQTAVEDNYFNDQMIVTFNAKTDLYKIVQGDPQSLAKLNMTKDQREKILESFTQVSRELNAKMIDVCSKGLPSCDDMIGQARRSQQWIADLKKYGFIDKNANFGAETAKAIDFAERGLVMAITSQPEKPLERVAVAGVDGLADAGERLINGQSDVTDLLSIVPGGGAGKSVIKDGVKDVVKSEIKQGVEEVAEAGVKNGTRSVIVEGGGLVAHEFVGGHLIARHIGQSEADMAARLAANPGMDTVSNFTSRATAEKAVSEVLDNSTQAIQTFLNNPAIKKDLVLNATSSVPVGSVLTRGANSTVSTNNLRVVIRKDSSPLGYYIVTGYPTP